MGQLAALRHRAIRPWISTGERGSLNSTVEGLQKEEKELPLKTTLWSIFASPVSTGAPDRVEPLQAKGLHYYKASSERGPFASNLPSDSAGMNTNDAWEMCVCVFIIIAAGNLASRIPALWFTRPSLLPMPLMKKDGEGGVVLQLSFD